MHAWATCDKCFLIQDTQHQHREYFSAGMHHEDVLAPASPSGWIQTGRTKRSRPDCRAVHELYTVICAGSSNPICNIAFPNPTTVKDGCDELRRLLAAYDLFRAAAFAGGAADLGAAFALPLAFAFALVAAAFGTGTHCARTCRVTVSATRTGIERLPVNLL